MEIGAYFKEVGIFHINTFTNKGGWWGKVLENTKEDNV